MPTSLEIELARRAERDRQQQQRSARAPEYRAIRQMIHGGKAAAPKETPKMANGITTQNSDGSVTVHGTRYTRDEFRAALEANIKAQREDPASAYRNIRDPNHQQTVAEINIAYRWLNGELSESDEKEIVTEWHAATQEESSEVATQPFQEIAEITGSLEGRTALQRAKWGQPLDARQSAIVERYKELETANNVQAYRERAVKGGTFKTARPHHIAPELYALDKISDPRERVHAIRSLKAKWRDDPNSHYNNVKSPEHKNAIEWMSRLYNEENQIGPQPEDDPE